jgi:hypothetical protein
MIVAGAGEDEDERAAGRRGTTPGRVPEWTNGAVGGRRSASQLRTRLPEGLAQEGRARTARSGFGRPIVVVVGRASGEGRARWRLPELLAKFLDSPPLYGCSRGSPAGLDD